MKTDSYQKIKKVVLDYFDDMERASPQEAEFVLSRSVSGDYVWLGSYPFRERSGPAEVAEAFWVPLKKALGNMQRRQDIFMAGNNELNPEEQWVMSMGYFMGNFTQDFLGIRHTNKIACLRYAEFAQVEGGKIVRTGLFVDLIGFMMQIGKNPLPSCEGACYMYPGPRDHNGLLFSDATPEAGQITLKLIDDMCAGVVPYGDEDLLPEKGITGHYWSDEMLWYGSAGASYTIPAFEAFQERFRGTLKDRKFMGHVCRFAEGEFGCFFGWPNIVNTPTGGYLGLPGSNRPTELQVVDVYYRRGDKLYENWVILDMPYWLKQQGMDVLNL